MFSEIIESLEKLSKQELLCLFKNGKNIYSLSEADITWAKEKVKTEKILADIDRYQKEQKKHVVGSAAWWTAEEKWHEAYKLYFKELDKDIKTNLQVING